jgi:hypothetical protein
LTVVAQGGQCGHQAWICADFKTDAHVGIGGRALGNLGGGVVDANEERDTVPADESVVDPQVGRDGGDIGHREPGSVLSIARGGQGDVAGFAHTVRSPKR